MISFAPPRRDQPRKDRPRTAGSPDRSPYPARLSGSTRPFTPNFPTAPARGQLEPPFIQPPASRPSYDLAGALPHLGPWSKVPIAQDFMLLKRLRESIPVLDTAVVRLRQLVGVPEVESDNETTQAQIRKWLAELSVSRVQQGWQNWVATWVDDGITYGRGNAEMVLNNARTDVYGIIELHPATVALRPQIDGYGMDVVQYQSMGGQPVLMNPDLQLMWANDIRADDPNGTSLFYSLTFVGEIYNTMTRALGQTWGRFGSPTYHINWEFPEDWNDPSGQQTRAILGQMQGNFNSAMQARAQGQLQDFFTTGTVKVEVVGAAGETLVFEEPAQSIMEQIVTKTGLPPFVLGFSWSTTERMTTVQAILLSEVIDAYRDAILPKLTRLIAFRQAIAGKPRNFKLVWPQVSLMDRLEEARADWMQSQAEEIKIGTWEQRVRLGINSMPDMAREFRPDLSEFDDEEIALELPDLVDKPPEPMPTAAPGAKPPRGPAGPTGEGQNMLEALTNGSSNGRGRH